MQDLILLNDGIVTIQKNDAPTYFDTLENFLKDGGNYVDQYTSIDYNRSVRSCWLNGEAVQEFPNEHLDALIDKCQELFDAQQLRKFPPKPETIESLREDKLKELDALSAKFEDNLNKDMFFTSSNGFKCNGDRRTKSNLQDIVTFFDLQAQGGKVMYRDYNNVERELTKEQVQVLLVEHVANGNALYSQKWALQEKINAAKSKDALKKLKLEFAMSDFSKKPVHV